MNEAFSLPYFVFAAKRTSLSESHFQTEDKGVNRRMTVTFSAANPGRCSYNFAF